MLWWYLVSFSSTKDKMYLYYFDKVNLFINDGGRLCTQVQAVYQKHREPTPKNVCSLRKQSNDLYT